MVYEQGAFSFLLEHVPDLPRSLFSIIRVCLDIGVAFASVSIVIEPNETKCPPFKIPVDCT